MMQKYGFGLRFIHWVMAILMITVLTMGFVMVTYKDCEPWDLYNLHKSLGVILFGFILLRILMRLITPAPRLPNTIGGFNALLAKLVAALMYLGMIIMPISGYALSNTNGFGVKLFGYQLPTMFAENPDLAPIVAQVHTYVGYALVVLIILHVLGVIYHHLTGEEILRRIT